MFLGFCLAKLALQHHSSYLGVSRPSIGHRISSKVDYDRGGEGDRGGEAASGARDIISHSFNWNIERGINVYLESVMRGSLLWVTCRSHPLLLIAPQLLHIQ